MQAGRGGVGGRQRGAIGRGGACRKTVCEGGRGRLGIGRFEVEVYGGMGLWKR